MTAGCGKSDVNTRQAPPPARRDAVPSMASVDPNTVAKADGPERAVHDFLEALRTGDDDKATQLLSTVARREDGRRESRADASGQQYGKFCDRKGGIW